MADPRFRDSLPPEFAEDVKKYLENPTCKCNHPIYIRVATKCKKNLKEYFPSMAMTDEIEKSIESSFVNTWSVINCHVDDLEQHLKKLPLGRKQLAVARSEDQVTVVVNELDIGF
jgi:hypothetical protein